MWLIANNTTANTRGGSSRLTQVYALLRAMGQPSQARCIRKTVATVHRPLTMIQSVTKLGLRPPCGEAFSL
jgi:hypothetical protein